MSLSSNSERFWVQLAHLNCYCRLPCYEQQTCTQLKPAHGVLHLNLTQTRLLYNSRRGAKTKQNGRWNLGFSTNLNIAFMYLIVRKKKFNVLNDMGGREGPIMVEE